MITPQNRIIIVDDQKTELERLTKAFLDTGIGCRPFEYEKVYNSPLKNVRLAFFDIDLGEKNIDTQGLNAEEIEIASSAVYNDLAYAINQYIAKDNGPYALMFWTKNAPLIEGFKKYIQNTERGYSDTAKPFFIGSLEKSEVNEENVVEKLEELFDNDKIKFFFEIEENTRLAGANTINKLHEIIPKDDNWGENSLYFENLDKVLSKISVNVLGFEYSREKPINGVYEGLSQLVLKDFLEAESKIDSTKLLKNLTKAENFGDVKFPDDNIHCKLNSIFHISEGDFENDFRGVVLEIDRKDQNILESLNIKDLNVWKNKLLSIKENKKELIDCIDKNFQIIAIEFSAVCDYSQRKPRLNKYVLGIITPIIKVKEIGKRIESSYHLGGCSFEINNIQFQIWLNLNYVFSTIKNDCRLGKPIFALNKEIVDMLGNKYASHVSRIGITSF